jgi:two-component system, sensor histidine kinase YesM
LANWPTFLKTLNQTRLEMLQEQINPHLLYNTRMTISYTAAKNNQQEIKQLSDWLGKFYRGILNRGNVISSLYDELEMVKRYISIMEMVYSLKITTNFDIDPDTFECYSLKLILQPIVENAIIHGIRAQKTGTIKIRTRKQGQRRLIIHVIDDGLGMNTETCDALNSLILDGRTNKGYGVGNVIRRVLLFFGQDASVRFRSREGKGTNIRICLPFLSKEEMIQLIGIRFQSSEYQADNANESFRSI